MGLFDYVRCKYPLPIAGANDLEFQTKSFDWPYMEWYEIKEDGTLWVEEYDIVDRSDPTAPEGSMARIAGCMSRENKRLVPFDFTGEVEFYGNFSPDWQGQRVEISSYFVHGKLRELHDLLADAARTSVPTSPSASGPRQSEPHE